MVYKYGFGNGRQRRTSVVAELYNFEKRIKLTGKEGYGMGKQHYLTYEERLKIEAWLRAKAKVAWIASQLGCSRQTIYNEIKRGQYIHTCDYWDEVRYSADIAQQQTDYNQSAKGRPLKIGSDYAYADFLEQIILKKKYSPAAAIAEARKHDFDTSICVTTLYSYIEKRVFAKLTKKDLWEKGKRKKRTYNQVKRIAHPALPSISERSERADRRDQLGHWEMDLIVSAKKGRSVLLTLTERVTRQELIFLLPNRKAATVRGVFDKLEKRDPTFRKKFKSITTDNGSEFLQYDKLTESIHGGKRFDIFYCHSYAAWEKGTNENHNRMIRRFFPKGTDFSKVSSDRVKKVEEWMNNYPRAKLGWKTPNELMNQLLAG